MNRKLLVTLLHKNIEELGMITNGFMEMSDYPKAMIQLAKRKTEDIQTILDEIALNSESFIPQETTDSPIEKEAVIEPTMEPLVQVEPTTTTNLIFEEKQIDSQEPIKELIPAFEISLDEMENSIAFEMNVEEDDDFDVEEKENDDEDDDDVNEDEDNNEGEDDTQVTVKEQLTVEETETSTETQTAVIEMIEESVEVVQTAEAIASTIETHTEVTKKITIAEKISNQPISRNDKLSHTDNSLSASIANKKISDIKQAISIGDRFRFQRELFKSNGEDMNKTLTYLNQLATLDEALSFLKSKYGWESSNEAAEDFYQLVKRKFL